MVLPFRYHKYMSYPGKLSWVFFLFIKYFLPISHCPVKSLQVSNGWQMNGSFEGKILEISFLFCCLYFFLIFLQLWTYFTRFWQAKLIDLSTKTNCAFLHNFFSDTENFILSIWTNRTKRLSYREDLYGMNYISQSVVCEYS